MTYSTLILLEIFSHNINSFEKYVWLVNRVRRTIISYIVKSTYVWLLNRGYSTINTRRNFIKLLDSYAIIPFPSTLQTAKRVRRLVLKNQQKNKEKKKKWQPNYSSSRIKGAWHGSNMHDEFVFSFLSNGVCRLENLP